MKKLWRAGYPDGGDRCGDGGGNAGIETARTGLPWQLLEPELRGKTVILIDDGVATGSTMRVAVRALNAQHPARLVVAVPTIAGSTYVELRQEVDELVALMTPERFYGVGQWYEDFNQTSDAEVTDLLERAKSFRADRKSKAWLERRRKNDRNGHEQAR